MSAVFNSLRRSLPVPDSYNNREPSPELIRHSGSFNSPKRNGFSRYSSNSSLNTFSVHYSSQPRRMTNTVRASNKSAILAVGEELRQLLHAEEPPIIKDRRYHLKTYTTCIVGHEMVDWLLRKGEVESRAEAVAMMQKLLENEVIHHGKYRLLAST